MRMQEKQTTADLFGRPTGRSASWVASSVAEIPVNDRMIWSDVRKRCLATARTIATSRSCSLNAGADCGRSRRLNDCVATSNDIGLILSSVTIVIPIESAGDYGEGRERFRGRLLGL